MSFADGNASVGSASVDEFSLGEEDADLDDLIDDEVNSPFHVKHHEEFNPDDIRVMDASLFTQNELNEAMEQRGYKPSGFFPDDARKLQLALNEEIEELREQERRKFEERKARALKQERMQRSVGQSVYDHS